MKIELQDASTAVLQIDGRLSASDLETLISDLAAVRGKMLPPVSEQRPSPDSDQRISVQDSPAFKAAPLRNGGLRLYLRNNGLGWLAFTLDASQVVALRGAITLATGLQPDAGPDLVNSQFPDGPKH